MTIDPHDEYGERLRRVLRAEADSIVPSADGLELIRSRVEKRRLRRAFLSVWWLKPALAAFGAVAVAGSAAVAAPLLQQVGGERPVQPVPPGAASTPTDGWDRSTGDSGVPSTTDASADPTHEPSATAEEPGGPFTIVKCYPAGEDTEKSTSPAQPSENSPEPSPSPRPSKGSSCAPGSTPTATVTVTPTPSPSACEREDGDTSECPSPTPSEPSTEPSP